MYEEYNNDEYAGGNETFGGRVFDPHFYPDEEWAVCDTEFESAVSAEERVVAPGTETPYWIAKVLDPEPENLFDLFVDQLRLIHGAQILGINHHRKNAIRSFGLAARHRSRSGENLKDIAPQYPKAATSRHAINAEDLLKLYADDLDRIDAAAITDYFEGGSVLYPEFEKCVKQLQSDADDAFRLFLSIATFRAGNFDPMADVLNPKSSHRTKIHKEQDCSRCSLNRLVKFFSHIGGIPPERKN